MAELPLSGPTRIDDFQIERQLGAGGMGIVYLARQISLNRLVALKVLGHSLSASANKARFAREAQAVARLKHPNIAGVYSIGQDTRFCYMALEYIEGVCLRDVIQRFAQTTDAGASIDAFVRASEDASGTHFERFDDETASVAKDCLERETEDDIEITADAASAIGTKAHVRQCCQLVHDLTDALAHAHEHGILHRDMKPDNLMLDRNCKVFVIDFGVARFFEDESHTQTGRLVGTPMYMSPEQITGRIKLDARTDIYSTGLVLYELLTLIPPVTAQNREGILRKILTKPLVPLSWKNPAVPKSVESIVHKATAKDPDERYQTSVEMRDDLQRFLRGTTVVAPEYEYKLDESEILRSRPRSVTLTAFLLLMPAAVLLFGLFIIPILMSQSAWWEKVIIAVINLVIFFGFFASARRVYNGYQTGVWGGGALCVVWLVMMSSTLQHSYPNISSQDLLYLLPYPVIYISLQFDPRAWKWFRYARKVRAEHNRIASRHT